MLSPRSRGKGSRRGPWREGGRRKRKVAIWRKQAAHAVDKLPLAGEDVVALSLSVPYGRTPGEHIYLFDQQVARIGFHYEAELQGTRWNFRFIIRVPVVHEAAVTAMMARIQKR